MKPLSRTEARRWGVRKICDLRKRKDLRKYLEPRGWRDVGGPPFGLYASKLRNVPHVSHSGRTGLWTIVPLTFARMYFALYNDEREPSLPAALLSGPGTPDWDRLAAMLALRGTLEP